MVLDYVLGAKRAYQVQDDMTAKSLLDLVAEPSFAAGLGALDHGILLVDAAVFAGVVWQFVRGVGATLHLVLVDVLLARGGVGEIVHVLL